MLETLSQMYFENDCGSLRTLSTGRHGPAIWLLLLPLSMFRRPISMTLFIKYDGKQINQFVVSNYSLYILPAGNLFLTQMKAVNFLNLFFYQVTTLLKTTLTKAADPHGSITQQLDTFSPCSWQASQCQIIFPRNSSVMFLKSSRHA